MGLGESWNCQHCGAPNSWVHAFCGSCDLPFRTVEREVEEVEPMQIRLNLPFDVASDRQAMAMDAVEARREDDAWAVADFDDESEED